MIDGTIAYIAIGANLGDRAATMHAAIDLLRASREVRIMQVSSFLENPAVGGPIDSPAFLNGAIEISTTLSADALLDRLLEIERSLGRVRSNRWSPRTIDLDLLLFGEREISTARLTIPHASMHARTFVLDPMIQIAPNAIHPTLKKTMQQLRDAMR